MLTESPSTFIHHTLSPSFTAMEIRSLTRLLIEDGLGIPMLDIYSGKVIKLSEEKETILREMLARLLRHEPIQYILGRTEFAGLTIHTAPGVLIPRPETEELVDWICKVEHPATLLDIGTGSGCIAIALSRHFPKAYTEAWDISPDALNIAKENNQLNKTNVHFKLHDTLAPLPTGTVHEQFDLIISNPPYVTEKERETMERNVLDWEPSIALFVPDDDPLRFYRAIARIGQTLLRPDGKLYFESNWLFTHEMQCMLEEEHYTDILFKKDLFGKERMVSARIVKP